MDPKALIIDKEYVLKHKSGVNTAVIYVHETINHYVFISNKEMISLTPSHVIEQIICKQSGMNTGNSSK